MITGDLKKKAQIAKHGEFKCTSCVIICGLVSKATLKLRLQGCQMLIRSGEGL